MGLDRHGLNLLRLAHKKYGNFGRVITLGRQAIYIGPSARRRWLGKKSPSDIYCENLLIEKFGATTVDSIDNSPYEKANFIWDMNTPLPPDLTNSNYDSVIDLGCSEHIFNVSQSLENITNLCRIGGRILHLLPANGFCGHGFYQFSPELFFSYYSSENGFADTEIYFADLADNQYWYNVMPPASGERINIRSSRELYLAVITRRAAAPHKKIQQSDYIHAWSNFKSETPQRRHDSLKLRLRELLCDHLITAKLLTALDQWLGPNSPKKLHQHPRLSRISIDL